MGFEFASSILFVSLNRKCPKTAWNPSSVPFFLPFVISRARYSFNFSSITLILAPSSKSLVSCETEMLSHEWRISRVSLFRDPLFLNELNFWFNSLSSSKPTRPKLYMQSEHTQKGRGNAFALLWGKNRPCHLGVCVGACKVTLL